MFQQLIFIEQLFQLQFAFEIIYLSIYLKFKFDLAKMSTRFAIYHLILEVQQSQFCELAIVLNPTEKR